MNNKERYQIFIDKVTENILCYFKRKQPGIFHFKPFNRHFVLCTNNEDNICEEITYERIKCVMEGYFPLKGKWKKEKAGYGMPF
ncbi:hypothetical protein PP175_28555 (plasmid) [Aneurinibacillus sp. Ricciae_BoGa-3]|uniref:hypothetical protein n=1 Tax=Aneurinibacillus sp. Ricciae_BoGa-3 TaxID=3022697 RepID=UPI0023420E9B|nr:hypothetical protein [Aneurinibacillus sp. Ricciae_BoGa-3]WCK57143.1 hypothetical protein PP175_28555 [Aneurinibacillus sp. Ricciae_BoGa-3]